MSNSDNEVTKSSWDFGHLGLYANVRSKSFALVDNPGIKFAFYFNGRYHFFFFGLELTHFNGFNSIDMQAKLWIQSSNGTKDEDRIVPTHTFKKVGDKCEFTAPSSGSEYNAFRSSLSGNGHRVIIHCELKCLNVIPEPVSSRAQLQWEAYQRGVGCDTVFQAGGKQFKVSSLVLVSQSKVFEAMLFGNFKEGTSKSADLGDIAANAMEAFIRYMYLGTLEKEDPTEELYKFGDKYMISDLKTRCASLLAEDLSAENAARRLSLSCLYNDKLLTEHVFKFINTLDMDAQLKIYSSEVWMEYLNRLPRS